MPQESEKLMSNRNRMWRLYYKKKGFKILPQEIYQDTVISNQISVSPFKASLDIFLAMAGKVSMVKRLVLYAACLW